MSMSLTISQPTRTDWGSRVTHDFSPRIPLAKSRFSPKPKVDSPVSSLRVSSTPDTKMSTPHRGLPPPSAMTLPDPGRSHQALHVPFVGLPNPPQQWGQGYDESMRAWLAAKAEDDRRKQEEERSKQESSRFEQRKIERDMLREALHAGIPPPTVPLIFAGLGGANLANISIELLQQYAPHLQAGQQQAQQQQSSPELRREPRLIGQAPPPSYPQQPQLQQVVPSQHPEQPQQPGPIQTQFSAYQSRNPPSSVPRSATHTQLPRLTTNDIYVQPQPPQPNPGSAHPLQQSQTVQPEQPTSSPSIYFHHWVPPSESKNNLPQTPASKGEPHSAHPGSHLSEGEFKDSPRKRKAQGPHQPAPPPSSVPPYTSPPFSSTSSGSRRKINHVRSGSNTSNREGDSRPDSRSQPEPPRTSQPGSGHSSAEESRPSETPSQPVEDATPRPVIDSVVTEEPKPIRSDSQASR